MSARKPRPARGTPVVEGMSQRDIAAALGVSTGWISRCLRLAAVPKETFEAIVESDAPFADGKRLSADRIINLSHGWDTSTKPRTRACPHCGKPIGRAKR